MKIYKIRHKLSGLFLRPNKTSGLNKDNFSKKGKVYQQKPSFKYYQHRSNEEYLDLYKKGQLIKYPIEEFEIVEYQLGENNESEV